MKESRIANFKRELLILTGHICVSSSLLDIHNEMGRSTWMFGGEKEELS